MQRSRSSRHAPWLLLFALAAATCGGPQSSGESHVGSLLLECSSETACGEGPVAGLDCFCSFCTLPCDDVGVCQSELGQLIPADKLRCRHPACLANDAEPVPPGAGVCDVACESDAECAGYDPDLVCVGGYCRATPESSGEPAPECPEGAAFVRGSSDGAVVDLCVDLHEVTVDDYAACVGAGACVAPELGNYYVADREQHPIDFVSAEDARAYCASVGKSLPSVEQWSWAGTNGRVSTLYPWGDAEPLASDAPPRVCALGVTSTCAVGSFPAGSTSAGIADLAGNVAELVESAGAVCAAGGSFLATGPAELDAAACAAFAAPSQQVGFRCVAASE